MLSAEEFQAIINSGDEFTLAVRGHLAVDSVLSELISSALPEPYEIEISRVSFPLKVDLAIALRVLRPDSRTLFLKSNSIRNRFAHEPKARVTEEGAKEIKAVMTDFHRRIAGAHFIAAETAYSTLRMGLAVAFFEARAAVDHVRARKREMKAWAEEVDVLLKETEYLKGHPAAKQFRNRVEARLVHSGEFVHSFRSNPTTHSGAKRPAVGAKRRWSSSSVGVVDLVLPFRQLPHGFPLQHQPVRTMHEAVQDGVGDGWVRDGGVPVLSR